MRKAKLSSCSVQSEMMTASKGRVTPSWSRLTEIMKSVTVGWNRRISASVEAVNPCTEPHLTQNSEAPRNQLSKCSFIMKSFSTRVRKSFDGAREAGSVPTTMRPPWPQPGSCRRSCSSET